MGHQERELQRGKELRINLQILNDSILQVQEWSIPIRRKTRTCSRTCSLSKQKTHEGATVQKGDKWKQE